MGKKSREKRERRQDNEQIKGQGEEERENLSKQKKPFLVNFIFFGVLLGLFTPLVLNSGFYFPFVGPKSLFFMAICEIVFFAWLFLILKHKKYRPNLNSITIAFILFLTVLILSSVLGVDLSRSFWSKYERMTGLLMWLHLFGFFLVISSTFKRFSDWKKIFIISTFVAIIICFMAFLEFIGVEKFKFSDRGGTTLGNTSFLGTYLMFNVFLALWLFFRKKHWGWKIYSLIGIALMFSTIYLSQAKAATLSTLGGFGLIFLLWLSFRPQNKIIRFLGKAILIIVSLIILTGLILLLIPGNFVYQKFIDLTGRARVVNWEMAQKGFLERPLLGWGPENYTLAFTKFFNPCLFIEECGGEIWFDRSHNIVFDTLVMTGILGLLTYLGLFIAFFYFLGRKYFKEKSIDFWTFSIFPAVLIGYFVQNLTVFDMATSLMMFIIILGFGASLIKKRKPPETIFISKNKQLLAAGILILIFFSSFFRFIIQPLKTDYLVIKSLKVRTIQERIENYKKTLETSPMGKYQIREFLAEHSQTIAKNNMEEILKDEVKKELIERELDFIINELEKTIAEAPLDYRTVIRLTHIHNVYCLIEPTKLALAEKYGKMALELSPTNQQSYWVLAQTKVLQGNFGEALNLAEKAIELEPKWFLSYQIVFQIAEISGNLEKAKEIAQKAVEANPDWEYEFKEY